MEAAEQLQAFSHHFLCEVPVKQLQLDELYAVLRGVKDGEIGDDKALKRLERCRHRVWTAIDAQSKLLVAINIGPRTLAMAQRVVHQVAHVLAPDCIPLCVTDGFREYLTALLTHYEHWVQPEQCQAKGPRPKPRWMPWPQLLYAQVVKSYRRRSLVAVKHRMVFGAMERVQEILAACGWQINTSFVERLNLAIRQRVAAAGRRVNTLCQGEDSWPHQLVVFQTYHNLVRPHASLHQPMAVPELTNGAGTAMGWRPCTQAMTAGLTDHVWPLKEVLLFRVSPWPQPQMV